jgi:hypothetical protein
MYPDFPTRAWRPEASVAHQASRRNIALCGLNLNLLVAAAFKSMYIYVEQDSILFWRRFLWHGPWDWLAGV